MVFEFIYLKAMYLKGQNNWPPESLSEQVVILVGRCPLTGCYFEPCHNTRRSYFTDFMKHGQTFHITWQMRKKIIANLAIF